MGAALDPEVVMGAEGAQLCRDFQSGPACHRRAGRALHPGGTHCAGARPFSCGAHSAAQSSLSGESETVLDELQCTAPDVHLILHVCIFTLPFKAASLVSLRQDWMSLSAWSSGWFACASTCNACFLVQASHEHGTGWQSSCCRCLHRPPFLHAVETPAESGLSDESKP